MYNPDDGLRPDRSTSINLEAFQILCILCAYFSMCMTSNDKKER